MGLFNKSNQAPRRQIRTMHTERPNEHGDLQYKAKSKLIGAAVLAAIGAVVLPFVLSSDEPIQSTTTSGQAPLVAPGSQNDADASGTISISAAPGVSVQTSEGNVASTTAETTEENTLATEGETSVAGKIDTSDLTESTEIPPSIASSVGQTSPETPVAVVTPVAKQETKPITKPEPTKVTPAKSAQPTAQKPATQVPATTVVPTTPTQSVAASTQIRQPASVEVTKPTKPVGEVKPTAPQQTITQTKSETKPAEPAKSSSSTAQAEETKQVAAQKEAEAKRVAEREAEAKRVAAAQTDAKRTVTAPKEEPKREEPKRTASTTTTPKSEVKRTDDGSVARALLEGKKPATTAATAGKANSNFPKPQSGTTAAKQRLTVQVGSFTSMDDARAQRDRLSSSGVSNVFVQNAVVNGRQTYRLRVGPFNSQESAQAALTRLRGLGHNGFITGN